MTKANECTCPSGDGSLAHPCPAHPAPVEQAGGDERVKCAVCVDSGKVYDISGEGPWKCYACTGSHEVIGYANGDELDNMLDDRTAVLSPVKTSFHTVPVYREARAALAHPSPTQARSTWAKLQAAEGRADTLEHRMMGMMTRHFAEAWRNRDAQKALDGYLSAGIAQLEQERDAALAEVKRNKLTIAAMNEAHAKLAADLEAVQARVAELEKQEPAGAPMPDEIHQMAFEEGQPAEDGDGYLFSAEEFDLFVQRLLDSCAAPVAQPEETPGEILAAKLIETWVTKHGKPAPWSTAVEITAVATNMPNDERERLLALDDDVDAQAQHSVPEGWRIERSAERIVVMNLKNGAGYAAARDGESGIAESVLYLLAADLLAAAPGKEVGHE
ncbi:hypothetical protein ACSEUP_02125 [Pseudomonas aeruginosa]|nr:hypothetical protein [Pseudomonas aeruginosa]